VHLWITLLSYVHLIHTNTRAAGKISLKSLCFYIHDFIWYPSFSLDLEEQLAASHHEIEKARRREIDWRIAMRPSNLQHLAQLQ
jgi:hypothetical protein